MDQLVLYQPANIPASFKVGIVIIDGEGGAGGNAFHGGYRGGGRGGMRGGYSNQGGHGGGSIDTGAAR
jgi:hypothetical protein